MSSESYHEPVDALSEQTKLLHRAVVSLTEELDAVDWYQQRAEATSDRELREVLLHNKDEEIEHAMMILEWLRRNDAVFAAHIETYLHSSGPIVAVEKEAAKAALGGSDTANGSLGLGSLKERA